MKGKKIFTICLAMAMTFTMMFAGAEAVFADASPADTKGAVVTAAEDSVVITPANMNTATTTQPYQTMPYTKDTIAYVKINMPKAGTVQFGIFSLFADTVVGLYENIDGTSEPLGTKEIPKTVNPEAPSDDDMYIYSQHVTKPGTYYIVFSTDENVEAKSVFGAAYVPNVGTNTTLMLGKVFYAAVNNANYRYYKVYVPGTRNLTISIPDREDNTVPSTYKIKLMNKAKTKNLFNNTVTLNEDKKYTTYAGVPAGTYYIGVSSKDSCYGIKVSAASVKEYSGSKKAYAKKIGKGYSRSGIITATQSSTSGDWYKIVLGGSQNVNLQVTTKAGGYGGAGLKVSWYDPGHSKASFYYEFNQANPSGRIEVRNKNGGQLKAGTYYIKVSKYGSGSGQYKLKWL